MTGRVARAALTALRRMRSVIGWLSSERTWSWMLVGLALGLTVLVIAFSFAGAVAGPSA